MEEENSPWKAVYIGTIISLLVLGLAYYFIAPQSSPFFSEEQTEKIAEFHNSYISGRQEGKKLWDIQVKKGWTNKGHAITFLADVSQGMIYSDDKLVFKGLTAPFAKAYRNPEVIEAFGFLPDKPEGKSQLSGYISLSKIAKKNDKKKQQWSKMVAGYLKHLPQEKKSMIEGHVFLQLKDSAIATEKIAVDHKNELAEIPEEAIITRKNGQVKATKLRYYSNQEKLETNNQISLEVTEKKVTTRVKASGATFFTDSNKEMTLSSSVEVSQGKKLAIADQAVYLEQKKQLTLTGNSKIVFAKAKNAFSEDTARKLKNPEAQDSLKEKTVLTAEQLVISTKSGDLKASGSVFAYQKGKEAKAQEAIYNEQADIITLSGNVYIKKNNDWVKAKTVKISIEDETFEAMGSVEASFKL